MKIPSCVFLIILGSGLSTPPVSAQIDWPMPPFDEQHQIGNSYGEYQYYGGSPYLHPGIDILSPAGTWVYAVRSGYVKAVLTTSANLHWRVAVGDSAGSVACDGWLYAHLEQQSITVTEGEYVLEGAPLGQLVTWPVAGFHHVHFVKIHQSGFPWTSDWEFVGNPLDELVVVNDVDPPEIIPVDSWRTFAFAPDGTSAYFAPGATLSGSVDIIARMHDAVAHPTWKLTPDRITYEIYSGDTTTGEIVSFAFTDQLFWDQYVDVIYRDDGVYNTSGDYASRVFYFVVTNTDGDSVVEASDAAGAWHTENFANGDWWVRVSAYDHGSGGVPNVTRDSVLVTVANGAVVQGWVTGCDDPPNHSGAVVTLPDLPGPPTVLTDSLGQFVFPDPIPYGDLHLKASLAGYTAVDTVLSLPAQALVSLQLDVDYRVGDCNADSVYNVFDVVGLVAIVFRESSGYCQPHWVGDLDYNRVLDVLDVVALVGHVFRAGAVPGPPQCSP